MDLSVCLGPSGPKAKDSCWGLMGIRWSPLAGFENEVLFAILVVIVFFSGK